MQGYAENAGEKNARRSRESKAAPKSERDWDNGSEVVIIGTIRVRRTGEGRRQVHIQENDHRREDGKQYENRSFFCRGCGLF